MRGSLPVRRDWGWIRGPAASPCSGLAFVFARGACWPDAPSPSRTNKCHLFRRGVLSAGFASLEQPCDTCTSFLCVKAYQTMSWYMSQRTTKWWAGQDRGLGRLFKAKRKWQERRPFTSEGREAAGTAATQTCPRVLQYEVPS